MAGIFASHPNYTSALNQSLAEKIAAAHSQNNAANAANAKEFRDAMQNSITKRGGSKAFAAMMGNFCERLDAKEMARLLENMENQENKDGVDEEEIKSLIEEYEKQKIDNAEYNEKREYLIEKRREAEADASRQSENDGETSQPKNDSRLIKALEQQNPDMRYALEEEPEEDEDTPGSVGMYLSGRMEEEEQKRWRNLVDEFIEEEQRKEESNDTDATGDAASKRQFEQNTAPQSLAALERPSSSGSDNAVGHTQ